MVSPEVSEGVVPQTEMCRYCKQQVYDGQVTDCSHNPCPFAMSEIERRKFYALKGLSAGIVLAQAEAEGLPLFI